MSDSLRNPYANIEAAWVANLNVAEQLKQITVLIVDDHSYMRSLIVRMLRDIGVEDVKAASGTDEALALIKASEASPHLILCDLKMPDRDGFAFVAALRQLPEPAKAGLPVLILTGNATADNIEEVVKLGVQGVLAKPLAATTLREHIVVALAGRTTPN
ncbi:MAG: response regulator [Elsteraceae bacterium]